MTPISFHPIRIFDETKHEVDVVAMEYVQKATDDVRHLIPVNVSSDGNCLYQSMVLLIDNPLITVIELRGMSILFCNNIVKLFFSSNYRRTCNK